jgi:hypothetical protein
MASRSLKLFIVFSLDARGAPVVRIPRVDLDHKMTASGRCEDRTMAKRRRIRPWSRGATVVEVEKM